MKHLCIVIENLSQFLISHSKFMHHDKRRYGSTRKFENEKWKNKSNGGGYLSFLIHVEQDILHGDH